MMHKERFEEIKKELELDWSDISYVVNQNDVKWLVNRVRELEQQNKRYREAIEVAIHNMAASDNLGVKFALGILEQVLESDEN